MPQLDIPWAISILYENKTSLHNLSGDGVKMEEEPGREKYPTKVPVVLKESWSAWGRKRSQAETDIISKRSKAAMDKVYVYKEKDDNYTQCMGWDMSGSREFRLFSNKMAPKFNSNKEEARFFDKRRAAKNFCKRDFKLGKVKEERLMQLGTAKDDHYYHQHKHIMTAFVAESFRRFETFVIAEFDRQIRPVNTIELRSLHYVLLNPEIYFNEEEFICWRRFVKITYDLGSVSIYEPSARSLYKTIQVTMKERIAELKADRELVLS